MVTVLGNATTGHATDPIHLDLPRANGVRRAHRPWCCDCKRTVDADELDTEGRCARCSRAAVSRAEAAARRAEEEPTAAPPGRTSRPAVARRQPAKPARRATRPARVPGTPTSGTLAPATTGRSGPERIELPEDDVAAAYAAGRTLAQIGETYGVCGPTVARCLDDAGIRRRGAPVKITDDLEADVRRLYLDEGLTQDEVAVRLGHSSRVIQRVMTVRKIPARRAVARDRTNHAIALQEQVRALEVRGVTPRDVKAWAIDQELMERITRGFPPQRVVTAYIEAHPAEDSTPAETLTQQVAAALIGIRPAQAIALARRLAAGDPVDLGPVTITASGGAA